MPCRCAPPTSPSMSSPTIQASSASASIASSAAPKYSGLGLPSTVASIAGRVLEPGHERARVEPRPVGRLPPAVPVQAVELGARPASSRNARLRFRYEKIAARLLALVGSRRRAPRRRSCRSARGPSRSSRMPGHRQREHALALRARAQRRCRSSGARRPRSRSPSHGATRRAGARDIVVEFVTKRMRWPASRSRRTASTAPGIGSPETCSTPSTSSRIAAMDAESIRSEVALPLLPVERAGRPARAEELDAGRGALRRRGIGRR